MRITVAGRELDYRSRQVFLARDILAVPKEDVVGTVDASLYFVNCDGALTAEARTLNLYEGDTQVSAVVRALENGPETKGLSCCAARGVQGPEGVAGRGDLLCEPVLGVAGGPAGSRRPCLRRFWRWSSPCCRWTAWRKCGSWWTANWQTSYGPIDLPINRRAEKRAGPRSIAGRLCF